MEPELTKEERRAENGIEMKIFLENKIRALKHTISPHFLVQQYNEFMQHFYTVVLNEMREREGQPPVYQDPINPRLQINLDEVLEWLEQEKNEPYYGYNTAEKYNMLINDLQKVLSGKVTVKKIIRQRFELVEAGSEEQDVPT